jgi:sulfopropanediol 3-dehydrogenase
VRSLPKSTIEDIQVRADPNQAQFALAQKDCLKDLEVETLPGVVLGHRNIP